MSTVTSALSIALVAGTVLGVTASTAEAGPEVRDHRANPAPAPAEGSVRYRKRPGPKVMLPLKIDIGAAGANTDLGWANGIAAAVGIHWANISPKPTSFDVGIGVFGGLLGAPEDPAMMKSSGVAYGGAYLEAGHTLAAGSFWRTWATARGEYLGSTAFGGDGEAGFGGAGRLSAELFTSGMGIEPRGLFLGTYALGVYIEAGARDMVEGVGAFHASAGFTFRTPLVFAP